MKKDIIGIVAEFNPFHNGHLKLINEIKDKYPNSLIIVAMSGEFVQRGELSIYNKWLRANYAINNNIDLVIEIPPYFVLNNANIFSKKAIEILYEFGARKIIFGSEELKIDEINKISNRVLVDNDILENLKKEHHSLPKAFEKFIGKSLKANDTLGICYVVESLKMNLDITFERIKRENNNEFISASKIREQILNNSNPKNNLIGNNNEYRSIESYYEIIMGKIITSSSENDLIKYVKKR